MRYFFLAVLLAVVTVVGIAGFRGDKFTRPPQEYIPDMDHQAKVKPQGTNYFFADGQGARLPVAGTVPMGLSVPTQLAADGYVDPTGFSAGHGSTYYNTGKMENGTVFGDGFPKEIKIDEPFLRRGQEVYNIHCAICHGQAGDGKGTLALRMDTTAKFGLPNVANFHDARFVDKTNAGYVPNGSLFTTITDGKGMMGRYGDKINVPDRWAVVAYVRALGLSRIAPLSDPTVKDAWDKAVGAGKVKGPKAAPKS